jgi:flagellar protein FliS
MNQYFQQSILNADPMDLIRMVYQRAIFCVRDAREHLRQKRIAERSAAVVRAYAALSELLASIRPETAPELCGRLQALYSYMQQRLLDANMQQDDRPLEEVLGLLITLSDAWSGAAEELAAKGLAVKKDAPSAASIEAWQHTGQGHEDTTRVAVSA